MKNYLFLMLVVSIIFTGCTSYRGSYDIGLLNVERPNNIKERYGTSHISNFEEEGELKYSYEDDLVKIIFVPLTTRFSFSLYNKSEYSIKLVWDEVVYVNENGSSSGVMNSGVRFIDKNKPKSSSVIVKNSKIDDIIIPNDNIYYASGWKVEPLFKNTASTKWEFEELPSKYIGKEVKIHLPLEFEGTINEYIFTFKIEDFTTK